MAVSADDVWHVAALARLGLEAQRVEQLAHELNGILAHMDVLAAVDTASVAADDIRSEPTRLRPDAEDGSTLSRTREQFAPQARDGFFLVPRLATHEDDAADA